MDLIYTDSSRKDLGVLHNYSLDYESNVNPDANTFSIEHPLEDNVMAQGFYWYVDGEEYGGKVDSIEIDTEKKIVTYGGRTWRGMLASKIIEPASGQDYYIVSGDLNAILSAIITKVNLGALFKASTRTTKTISNYRFYRYTDALSGINKMLADNGYKLIVRWDAGKVELSAATIVDWSNEMEIASDTFDFVLKKDNSAVNHMIGLGAGELRERLVIHRYVDNHGNISSTPYYTGLEEVVGIYDSSNTEDVTELTDGIDEKLKEASVQDALDIKANNIEADLGDLFTATSLEAGISVRQYVVQKVTNLTESTKKTQYWVGSSMY